MVYEKFNIFSQDVLNLVIYAAGVLVVLHQPTTYIFMNAGEILMDVRIREQNRRWIQWKRGGVRVPEPILAQFMPPIDHFID